jgi:hypothetical protein
MMADYAELVPELKSTFLTSTLEPDALAMLISAAISMPLAGERSRSMMNWIVHLFSL